MKIGLLGYGKMGQTIEKSVKERKHEIVYIADKNMEEGDLEQADIAINFSVPEFEIGPVFKKEEIALVDIATKTLDDYMTEYFASSKKQEDPAPVEEVGDLELDF